MITRMPNDVALIKNLISFRLIKWLVKAYFIKTDITSDT